MSLKLLSISALTAVAFAAGAAEAQSLKPIGSTVAVVNLVTAEFNRDTRTLGVGDEVNQDEVIEVGLDGSGEIELEDETKLALGPGARLALDKFIYDPDKADGSILINLAKGTFRFITGVAAKPSYVIRTPVASITVRGTIFDLFIRDDGLLWVLLHEGAVRVCNDRGNCRELDEPGKLLQVIPTGEVGVPVRWAELSGPGLLPFASAFPFVVKPPKIDPNPIFSEDAIKEAALPPPTKPPSADPDRPKKKVERPKPPKKKPVKEAERPKKKPPKKTADKSGPSAEDIKTGIAIGIGIGAAIGGINKGKRPKDPPGRRPDMPKHPKPRGGGYDLR